MGVHRLDLTIRLTVAVIGLWMFDALLDTVLDNATIVRRDIAIDVAIHERVTPMAMGAVWMAGAA